MKKSIYTVFAFVVFAASAFATQISELEVKVPFAFKVGTTTLPAGAYKVIETSPGIVLIRGEKVAVFMPEVLLDMTSFAKPRFTFSRAGDGYVLRGLSAGR